METALLMEVEQLRRASAADLRRKHREVFGEETTSRHREHLFRRIAWRFQARTEGDLSERARIRAREIAQDADLRVIAPRDFFTAGGESIQTVPSQRNPARQDRRLPLRGTLLNRSWKGRNILVEVLRDGFRYKGRHYSSISAIAQEVTGTRWNDVAFFGLARPAGKAVKETSRDSSKQAVNRHAEKTSVAAQELDAEDGPVPRWRPVR